MTAVVTATALSSTIASLICGLGANLPVGLSPGMGLNAYLVFSQVRGTVGGEARGGGTRLTGRAQGGGGVLQPRCLPALIVMSLRVSACLLAWAKCTSGVKSNCLQAAHGVGGAVRAHCRCSCGKPDCMWIKHADCYIVELTVLCACVLQVLGMDVPVAKALAGCMVAAGVVGLLAVIRVLNVILGIVPDSIKLAVVSNGTAVRD